MNCNIISIKIKQFFDEISSSGLHLGTHKCKNFSGLG